VGALQGRQVDRCGLIEEILPLLFVESIPEAENPILAVVSEATACFLKTRLSAALVSHALYLTPRESRAYSTAHPEPESAPPNHAQPQPGVGRKRLVRKGLWGPGPDFSYLT
jgi:hypothetical protein